VESFGDDDLFEKYLFARSDPDQVAAGTVQIIALELPSGASSVSEMIEVSGFIF
jgi:hypothetical protein